MRILLTGILACALVIVVEISFADPPQPPPPVDNLTGVLQPRVATSLDSDKEIAGLSRGSRPVLLTWDRIYALALVRARAGPGAFTVSLDPAALGEEAARQGVADFARFRNDFCADAAGAGERFRDPSAAVLQLLGRLQTIDNARRNVATHENLMTFLKERVQGESSGLHQLDVDMVFASLVRARQKLADEISQFREGLDELKVVLGLSPRAAVILDRPNPEAFRAVRDSVDKWNRSADRSLRELTRLIERLPALGEVVVDGQPILAKLDKNPDLWEEILTGAAQLAIKNRSDRDKSQAPANAGVQLELWVRRRLRNLFETRRAYETEKRSYELAIRLEDQTFERMVAPSSAGLISSRSPLLEGLIEQVNQVLKVEDRLVGLWTSFRTERLALYRDLGVLPYKDWSSFYADLSAGHVAAEAIPAVKPRPAAGDAPPTPAPTGRP